MSIKVGNVNPQDFKKENGGWSGRNVQLQSTLMMMLASGKPMTIEEVVGAFPSEKWIEIFEALAQLYRENRVFCRISQSEMELAVAYR